MYSNEYDNTVLYPYCYKIKDGCPPCSEKIVDNSIQNESDYCLELLANYVVVSENVYRSQDEKDEAKSQLGRCLKKLGDLYNKANIELYVNPNTKDILFPDQQRIQSSFNQFLREIGSNSTNSPKEYYSRIEILKIFNILLNNKFRDIYNNLYVSEGLASPKSLKPKEYGITRLLGSDKEVKWNLGGKKKNRKQNKTKRKSKANKKYRRITRVKSFKLK